MWEISSKHLWKKLGNMEKAKSASKREKCKTRQRYTWCIDTVLLEVLLGNQVQAQGRMPEIYLFTFQNLHDLRLAISKRLEQCLVAYLSSQMVTANQKFMTGTQASFAYKKLFFQRTCFCFLRFKRRPGTSMLQVVLKVEFLNRKGPWTRLGYFGIQEWDVC